MKILQLAGTSDARKLAIELNKNGHEVITTVVTENAALELENVGLQVLIGRLSDLEIAKIIRKKNIDVIVDATHPYAEEASKNAMKAADHTATPYIRYERPSQTYEHELITKVDSYESASELAVEKRGTIMLTTGSKTLQIFTEKLLHLDNTRVVARMLPTIENLEKCEKLGVPQKDIIAIQGPFSKELNLALFKQFEITLMITKESGQIGSVDEKIQAALELGIEIILIKRPTIKYEKTFETIQGVIKQLADLKNRVDFESSLSGVEGT